MSTIQAAIWEAYDEVAALGGYHDPADPAQVAYCRAIDQALAAIDAVRVRHLAIVQEAITRRCTAIKEGAL